MADNSNVTGWSGWVYFAGVLLVIRGIAQALLGVSELGEKKVFFLLNNHVVTASYYLTWGWIDLILGIVIVAAGFSLLHGSFWARVIGTVVAGLGLLTNLVFLPSYPVWSIAAGIVDVLIIYALVVRAGGVDKRA